MLAMTRLGHPSTWATRGTEGKAEAERIPTHYYQATTCPLCALWTEGKADAERIPTHYYQATTCPLLWTEGKAEVERMLKYFRVGAGMERFPYHTRMMYLE